MYTALDNPILFFTINPDINTEPALISLIATPYVCATFPSKVVLIILLFGLILSRKYIPAVVAKAVFEMKWESITSAVVPSPILTKSLNTVLKEKVEEDILRKDCRAKSKDWQAGPLLRENVEE